MEYKSEAKDSKAERESGRGLPHSKTWRNFVAAGAREASWSAPILWRFQARVRLADECVAV